MAALRVISPSQVSSLEFEAVDEKTRAGAATIVTDVKVNGELGLLRQGSRLGDIPKDVDPKNPGSFK